MCTEKDLVDQDIGDEWKNVITGKEYIILLVKESDKPNIVTRIVLEDGKLISEIVTSGKNRKKS